MTDEPPRPTPTNVTSLRMPGQVPPEAQALALERLVSAMTMVATINRTAVPAYRVAFQTAMAAAHYGDQGMLVEKILANLLKQLDASIAGLPNQPPPAA